MFSPSVNFKIVHLNRKFLIDFDFMEINQNNSISISNLKLLLAKLQNFLASIQKERMTLEADQRVKEYDDKFKIGPGAEVALEMASKPDFNISNETIKFKTYILYYFTLLVDPRNISVSNIDKSYSKLKKNIFEAHNKPLIQYLFENFEKISFNAENVFKLEKLLLFNSSIFNDSNQGDEDILVLGIKDINTYLGLEENKNKYWEFIVSIQWISLINKTISEIKLLISKIN